MPAGAYNKSLADSLHASFLHIEPSQCKLTTEGTAVLSLVPELA